MQTARPRRSVLYMPGSNARALEKARSIAADALILDLEDAVAPDAKDVARAQVCEAVAARGFGKREVIVRINALSTPWGEADPRGGDCGTAGCDPRSESFRSARPSADRAAHGCVRHRALGDDRDATRDPQHCSARGSGRPAGGFVMGTNDLIKELRGQHTPDRANLSTAGLGLSVAAARAHGLAAIDGVFNDIQDADGFAQSCRQARSFGFDGKTLIHPSQVAPCNEIFAPSADEVAAARQVIAAFDLPENKAKGAIKLDGRMVRTAACRNRTPHGRFGGCDRAAKLNP